ncbi:hypothetical protein FRC18_001032 [Serendipita sp. 400]|nr:hypothetical protein FRC18_001032 [Serendipita sp. 400]
MVLQVKGLRRSCSHRIRIALRSDRIKYPRTTILTRSRREKTQYLDEKGHNPFFHPTFVSFVVTPSTLLGSSAFIIIIKPRTQASSNPICSAVGPKRFQRKARLTLSESKSEFEAKDTDNLPLTRKQDSTRL